MRNFRDVTSSGLLNLSLPYPLPFKSNFVKSRKVPVDGLFQSLSSSATISAKRNEPQNFKEEKFDLGSYSPYLKMPTCVGELVMMMFLEVKDIVKLFTVSKHLRKIAINSLQFLNKVTFIDLKDFGMKQLGQLANLNERFSPRFIQLVSCSSTNFPIHSFLPSCKQLFQNIERLKIMDTQSVNLHILEDALNYCTNLTHLYLDTISDTLLLNLLNSGSRGFKLLRLSDANMDLTLKGYIILAELFSQNQAPDFHNTLILDNCRNIQSKLLTEFAKSLRYNASSNVYFTLKIVNPQKSDMTDLQKFFDEILSHKSLVMKEIVISGLNLSATTLRGFKANNKCLEMMDVHNLDFEVEPKSNSVLNFLPGCQAEKLRKVKFSKCFNLSTIVLASIFSCIHLEELYLPAMTRYVDNDFLKVLADKCKALKRVDFSSCSLINDIGLDYFARRCVNLTDVNLARCEGLTNHAMKTLILHSGITLISLSVFCCFRVSNPTLFEIAVSCKRLEVLDVGWVLNITSAGVREVLTMCRNLRFMFIQGMSNITDMEKKTLEMLAAKYSTHQFKKLVSDSSMLDFEYPDNIHKFHFSRIGKPPRKPRKIRFQDSFPVQLVPIKRKSLKKRRSTTCLSLNSLSCYTEVENDPNQSHLGFLNTSQPTEIDAVRMKRSNSFATFPAHTLSAAEKSQFEQELAEREALFKISAQNS